MYRLNTLSLNTHNSSRTPSEDTTTQLLLHALALALAKKGKRDAEKEGVKITIREGEERTKGVGSCGMDSHRKHSCLPAVPATTKNLARHHHNI
jgi:hypothetical protein